MQALKGTDRLATQIAQGLEGEKSAALIDYGAGERVPALPIVSRLTHMKQILLFLVGPIYPKDEPSLWLYQS